MYNLFAHKSLLTDQSLNHQSKKNLNY